jgi:hypothetical protein
VSAFLGLGMWLVVFGGLFGRGLCGAGLGWTVVEDAWVELEI